MIGGTDMNTKTKKGFTLVELIVVMAIFSILLLGVMAITKPVSVMFKNTSLSEKTYAYANNIQVYLQGRLEYSEDIVVATSDNMDANSDGKFDEVDLAVMVEDFRKSHFDNTVGYNGKDVVPLKGKIHVLRMVNNADGTFPQGAVTERVFDFQTDKAIPTSTKATEEQMLNPAFFTAKDSAYNFSYSLGAANLELVPTPATGDSGEVYRALDKDVSDENVGISTTTLAMSIVLDKKTGGAIDVAAGAGKGANGYRAYRDPVALQVVNLPLTNITYRSNHTATAYGISRTYKDPATGVVEYQPEGGSLVGNAYDDSRANKTVDFNNDIYFIFCYTDEIINS